ARLPPRRCWPENAMSDASLLLLPSEHTCIVLRLRRVTVADAYVAVPVDRALNDVAEPDGKFRVDFDKFVAGGKQFSKEPCVQWLVETETLDPPPTQGPVPEGRTVFDVHRT